MKFRLPDYFRVFFLSVMLASCSESKSVFAFREVRPIDEEMLESVLYRPSEFRIVKPPVEFMDGHDLWMSYTPARKKAATPYAISLAHKSLDFMEIDLRNRTLDASVGSIVDRYQNLKPGEYRFRIALDGKIIDELYFRIIPGRGTGYLDYDAPLSTDPQLP